MISTNNNLILRGYNNFEFIFIKPTKQIRAFVSIVFKTFYTFIWNTVWPGLALEWGRYWIKILSAVLHSPRYLLLLFLSRFIYIFVDNNSKTFKLKF